MAARSIPTTHWMMVLPLLGLTALSTWWLRQPAGQSTEAPDGWVAEVSVSSRAADWLTRMQDAYQALDSYGDRTRMEFRGRQGDSWFEDRAEMDVRFQRPDQLALRAAHRRRMYHLAADGGQLVARIDDPLAEDFQGQVVRHPLTTSPTIATLLSAFEMVHPEQADAPRTSALATLPAPLDVTPLRFLLGQGASSLQEPGQAIDALPSTTLRNRPVHRVRISTPQGPLVLWLDAEDFLLRRVEYPVGLNRDGNATLTAEFTDIETNRPTEPQAFRFSVPSHTRWVRHFVVPPLIRTNPRLGQRIDSLRFTDVWGQDVGEDRWRDRVAVLVWFSRHPSSRGVLSELNQLMHMFDQAGDCYFLAICTEPTTEMSHSDVLQLARQWELEMPVARDLEAAGRDLLGIEEAPTIAILDRAQRLQMLEAGGDAELDRELAAVLEKVLGGEDVAATYRAVADEQQQHYQAALQQATW